MQRAPDGRETPGARTARPPQEWEVDYRPNAVAAVRRITSCTMGPKTPPMGRERKWSSQPTMQHATTWGRVNGRRADLATSQRGEVLLKDNRLHSWCLGMLGDDLKAAATVGCPAPNQEDWRGQRDGLTWTAVPQLGSPRLPFSEHLGYFRTVVKSHFSALTSILCSGSLGELARCPSNQQEKCPIFGNSYLQISS